MVSYPSFHNRLIQFDPAFANVTIRELKDGDYLKIPLPDHVFHEPECCAALTDDQSLDPKLLDLVGDTFVNLFS
jgi:hypothetical protein